MSRRQNEVQQASEPQRSHPHNRTATEPTLQRHTLKDPLQQSTLQTRFQRYTLGEIQCDAGESAGNSAAIHRTAGEGLRGSSGSLPHLDIIQHSFGSHDVAHIQAHTGSAAASANEAMGSEAYATGNHVAFKSSSPSLHTAAHEAAHVVQQRAGVSLKGGVGQVGDKYERHADAVADAVVQGRSAESLLGPVGSSESTAVQASDVTGRTLQRVIGDEPGESSPNMPASGIKADNAMKDLDARINQKHQLFEQIKDAEGRTEFTKLTDERSGKANESGHFWSLSEKDAKRYDTDGALSGEYQAKHETEESGRMMAQTKYHVGAIELIRALMTKENYEKRREEEGTKGNANYKADENERLPPTPNERGKDGHAQIQKDPEDNLVYTHFRSENGGVDNQKPDFFPRAWGVSSENFATDLGAQMVPTWTHGAVGHGKFDETVQITYELKAFTEAANKTTAMLNDTGDTQLSSVDQSPYPLSKNRYFGGINIKHASNKWSKGVQAQKFVVDDYRKRAVAGTMKSEAQQEYLNQYEERSNEGSELMKIARKEVIVVLDDWTKGWMKGD